MALLATDGAEEALAGGPEEHGVAEVDDLLEPGEQAPVVLRGLGEADAGVEHELLGGGPDGAQRLDPGRQLGAHLGDDVGVVGPRLHVVGVAAPVHDDEGSPARRDEVRHLRVGQAPAHVVDDRGPGLEGGRGDARPHGVDGDGDALDGQRAHDGHDTAQLLVLAGALGAGAGGLSPDVDDARSGGDEGPAVGDRGVGLDPPPAVAEGVRRDVDDAHDDRTGPVVLRRDPGQDRVGHRAAPVSRAIASARVVESRS